MRTLIICALATTLTGCSSQPPSRPSCLGLNPLPCLTAVDVPIEPVAYDSGSDTAKPVASLVALGDAPPRPQVFHAAHRAPRPAKVAKAAPAVPIPVPSPRPDRQTAGVAPASDASRASTDPPPATEAAQARTTAQQVAAASAVAEGLSPPTLDATLDTRVAVVVAGADIKSVNDLAGKTIAIDDRYSESSIGHVKAAMATAGAQDVQLSKGQSTAIGRLVAREVSAAIVGLVSASAADSFPELPRMNIFRIPLSPRAAQKQQ